jgi:two-component system, OmpR family, response regulator RstA
MQKQSDIGTGSINFFLILTDHDHPDPLIQLLHEDGNYVHHCNYEQFEVELLKTAVPNAVLIDLNTPSVNSISICQTLRASYEGPILFLTARTDDRIPVLGLEMGADDFLFKPQPEIYLLAKLRALLRRSEKNVQRQRRMVQLGELAIDFDRREVRCSGDVVPLTTHEFGLLWLLAENTNSILSRDEIHQSLYNNEYNGFDRSIDIHISRIRQKIGDDSHRPRYLKTFRGVGYSLMEGA